MGAVCNKVIFVNRMNCATNCISFLTKENNILLHFVHKNVKKILKNVVGRNKKKKNTNFNLCAQKGDYHFHFMNNKAILSHSMNVMTS